MNACLIALVFGTFQLPAEPITLTTSVCRAATAVRLMSETAKQSIRVDEEVGDEVVYITVKDRPLAEVMIKMAEATRAEWRKQEDGSYLLFRPEVIKDVEERKEYARKVAAIKATLAKMRKGLQVPWNHESLRKLVIERDALLAKAQGGIESEKELSKIYARIEEIEAVDPLHRAMTRIFSDIKPEDLVNVIQGQRLLFTFNPNRAQMALGANSMQAMQRLQEEQLLWGNVLKSIPYEDKPGEEETRFMTDRQIDFFGNEGHFSADSDVFQRTKPYTLAPAKISLSVCYYADHDYRIEMKMLSATGVEVVSFDDFDLSTGTYESPEIVDAGTTKIDYTPETRILASTFDMDGQPTPEQVKQLLPFVTQPLVHDPLKFGNAEALDVLAKARKKNVVACLPDDVFLYGAVSETLEEYEATLKNYWMASIDSPDYLVLQPRYPVEHWKERCRRPALAEYIGELQKAKRIDIDPYVKFVLNGGQTFDQYAHLLIPEQKVGWASVGLPFLDPFTELYGGLSEPMKSRLKRGEKILYSELTPRQRLLSSVIAYSAAVNTSHDWPASSRNMPDEPTVELPNGLPPNSGIIGSFGDDTVVVFHNNTEWSDFYEVNLNEGGGIGGWSGPPPRIPDGGMKNAKYSVHRQSQVTLKVELSPGHFVVGKFYAPLSPAAGPPVPLSQLPAEMQAKLKDAIKFMDRMGSFGGGGEPPPAPTACTIDHARRVEGLGIGVITFALCLSVVPAFRYAKTVGR